MKNYSGSLITVEGRGQVLVTRIPKEDPLPVKGSQIKANGITFKIRDVEYASHGDFGRTEMVGLLLAPLKKS